MEEKNVLEIEDSTELFDYLQENGCVTLEDGVAFVAPYKPSPSLIYKWQKSCKGLVGLIFMGDLKIALGLTKADFYGLS